MKRNLFTFIIKCVLAASPFLALLISYFVLDPFMVLRHYDDYDSPSIQQSEGMIAWTKYKDHRKQMRYDSFIFGTSCSKAFRTYDWNRYIKGRPYRMFCNDEGIGDILLKLQALAKQPDQKIKHVLIVAEPYIFEHDLPQAGVVHIMPPDVSGMSRMSFQIEFLQAFYMPSFLSPFLKYQFTHKYDNSMRDVININGKIRDHLTNDAVMWQDDYIKKYGEKYWQERDWHNQKCQPSVHAAVIKTKQRECLSKIKALCDSLGSDIKIAIGPTFKCECISKADLKIIKDVFGSENVLNFSDEAHAKYRDYHYYYDPGHYRDIVGNEMMKQLYK